MREMYEAMARGDGKALAARLRADTRWVIAGDGPTAGTYTGPNEIFAFWKRTAEQTGGGLRLELRDVLANDERTVSLVDVSGRRGERTFTDRQVVVTEWDGETITASTFIYEHPQAYDEFWA